MTKIFTIGHSTREIDEFVELLKSHGITQLVDIRTIPKSRHNPQYGQTELVKSLKQHKIEYRYLKELGGLRPAVKNSTNLHGATNLLETMQTICKAISLSRG